MQFFVNSDNRKWYYESVVYGLQKCGKIWVLIKWKKIIED